MASDGNWVTYVCWIGEDYGLVSVDVERAEVAPSEVHPISVSVEVKVREPDDRGFPPTDELAAMHAFEDALADALGEQPPLGYATRGGLRTAYFYAADAVLAEHAVHSVAARTLPDHEIRVEHFDDPAWEQYFGFLYPNKLAWRYIYDNAVLAQLREHGDDGSAPRPIDHCAYFPSRKARRSFQRAVEGQGYVVRKKQTGERGSPRRFMLEFQPREPMAPAGIHSHTERLVLLAEEHEGEYDGWGSQVVSSDAS